MIERHPPKPAVAQTLLSLYPPSIRRELQNDDALMRQCGLKTDVMLGVEGEDVQIRNAVLFDAMRDYYAGKRGTPIVDTRERKWRLKKHPDHAETHGLMLVRGSQQLPLSFASVLMPDKESRLSALEATAAELNLSPAICNQWRPILEARHLMDAEVWEYLAQLQGTPRFFAQTVSAAFSRLPVNVRRLVPTSAQYYAQLIGPLRRSLTIRDYAAAEGGTHIQRLAAWRPPQGFLDCLQLAAHPAIARVVATEMMPTEMLANAFNDIAVKGDWLSKIGAIEVGALLLASRPELQDAVIRLVATVLKDGPPVVAPDGAPTEMAGGVTLLSALFVLVSAELSRAKVFSSEPVFYRRLAALAQAAVIARAATMAQINVGHFSSRAFARGWKVYWLQALVDMREAPRWRPGYVTPTIIQAQAFRRIVDALEDCALDLAALVSMPHAPSAHDSESLDTPASRAALLSFLPGPLEGDAPAPYEMTTEEHDDIASQLQLLDGSPRPFTRLINAAMYCNIPQTLVILAVEALKRRSQNPLGVQEAAELTATLSGLAGVAAMTRSHALADAIRVIMRIYRRDGQYALAVTEAVDTCLIAAASREDKAQWRECVGAWLTELAFGELQGDDGVALHNTITHLCRIDPGLWSACGRAEAALQAFTAMRP